MTQHNGCPKERKDVMPQWRHKKRGTVYEIISDSAALQCSCAPNVEEMFDDDTFTVYRSVTTGAVYVRPTAEFQDGRFEQLPD